MSGYPARYSRKDGASVLSYATNVSVDGLLASTNNQRAANALGGLALNGQLNSAAQAKANDMVTRDYWSHNTPEGNPPWVFITNAGYSYNRAGENLAYGYATSNDTIVAWMNSPTHRENLLETHFTQVGFGIANAPNYTGDPKAGAPAPATVIVAMYAEPYTTPVAATQPQPTVVKPADPAPTAPVTAAPVTTPSSDALVPKDEKDNIKSTKTSATKTTAANTSAGSLTKKSSTTNRLQLLTKSSLPWLGSMLFVLTLSGSMIVLGKHGIALHRFVVRGERYVLQHALFDMTVISLIGFYVIAMQHVGVIL
ncbi:MAG: CAP domain-containing protein [Candidatus Saccharibacteria bacterium]